MSRYGVFHPSVDGQAITINTADTNGVKTSIATSTSAVTYDDADLNGAEMDGVNGTLTNGLPRAVSVTTSASAATYNTGSSHPIVVRGRHWRTGQAMQEQLLLTDANGGETINGNVLWHPDHALTIDVPAQVDALGAFEFGTTIATAIEPPAHSISVGDTSGGNAIYYRLSKQGPATTPLSGSIASDGDERAWEVAELHVGTTVDSIVAHYGMPMVG